jgi:molecular chaperone Hsp33
MSETIETWFDQPLVFTIAARHIRGRLVRLGPTLNTILGAHSYPPVAEKLLAEALVLTVLLGSTLKAEGGQMTLQAQTGGGPIELLVCDYRGGELRGYVRFDEARLGDVGPNPSLYALFGQGYLAITFDMATSGQRYQGIVPLEGDSLAEACQNYFAQSEQVPTLIRVAVRSDGQGCVAAGLLIQHLPDGEEGRERLHVRLDHSEWEHLAALAGSTRHDELVDADLSLEALVWRLFHEEEEVRVVPGHALSRGCRCSVAHYESVIAKFPEDDRADMRNDDGVIVIDCAFCSRLFEIQG